MFTEMIPIETATTGWVIDAAKPVETAVASFPGAKGERFADLVKSIAVRIGPDLAGAILNIKSVRNFVAHEHKVKKWSVPANYEEWCSAVTDALSVLRNAASIPTAYQAGPYVQEAARFRTGLCNKKCVPIKHPSPIKPVVRRAAHPTNGLEYSNAKSYEAIKAFVNSIGVAMNAEATPRGNDDTYVTTISPTACASSTGKNASVSIESIAAEAQALNTRSIGATIGLGAALGVGLAITAAIAMSS